MMRAVFRICLLGVLSVLTACTVLPEARPVVMNKYVLEYAAGDANASQRTDLPVMLITVPRAHGGYDTAKIAYRRQAFGLRYYAKSRWADTPARMLAPLVAEALNNSGEFQAIYAAPGALSARYRLDSELIDFYQDFTVQPSEIRITLRAQLVSLAENRVLATRLFEMREPAGSEDAYGGVQAANRAAGMLVEQLTAFCTARSGE